MLQSSVFHEDIYPPTASQIPSLSADEWISGQSRGQILMSMLVSGGRERGWGDDGPGVRYLCPCWYMSVMEAGGGGDNDRPLVQILMSMLVSVGKGGGAEDDDIPWWREGGLMIPWGEQICTCLFLFMWIK